MKIGILSRNHQLYSTQRLQQAARARHHNVQVIDTLYLAHRLGLFPQGRSRLRPNPSIRLPAVDGIIPRIGASITAYGVAVVDAFEAGSVSTTASATAIAQSRDKSQSLQLMQEAGLPLPKTAFISRLAELTAALEVVQGPPAVIKILEGTQGRGVILTPTLPIARSIVSLLFRHGEKQLLVQEYIEEAGGQDLRLLIIGRHCVAAMRREAPSGDFRANLHRGGTSTAISANEKIVSLAVQAAGVHNLGVAGVDLISSRRGPLLLEVNSSPGLEGIERTTGVDVAGAIVRYLETRADSPV